VHPVDLCSTFGPLASMHAALDAVGGQMPCAVATRFEGLTAEALEEHLLAAAQRFPILASRLAWIGDRPVLQPGAGSPIAASAPLDFTATNAPLAWQAAIQADRQGAALTAVFSHALADGGSMLRLIGEIESRLGRNQRSAMEAAPLSRHRPAALPWLAGFLAERMRSHLVLAPAGLGPMGASWFRTSTEDRDRMIARARSVCGRVIPFMSAAAALAAVDLSSGRQRVSLNIPISRSQSDAFEGFGFGVGSVIFGQDVDSSMDTETLAKTLAVRIDRQAKWGWDGGLEWFLGPDPRRHLRFARIRARQRPDPAINVSWKGFHRALGGPGGALDLACFGAAPMAHVSAHADIGGLSVSLTAPRSPAIREAFLRALAKRLGIAGELSLHIYPGGDSNCSAARSA
jgi:hypothetical protein